MTRVLVAIPWRPQEHRLVAFDLTLQRYAEILPEPNMLICTVGSLHEPFCLAACRNQAARTAAEQVEADVVVIGDADTLPEREPLLAAIEGAATDGLVHLPYTEYRSLRADGTAQYRAGKPLADCDHLVVEGACSGVYVTTPKTWWAHGGQDERFLGWGGEDAAWYAAHTTLLGVEPVRHEGRVFALHHESAAKDGEQYTANFALVYRYHQAQGNEAAMRALIAESVSQNATV